MDCPEVRKIDGEWVVLVPCDDHLHAIRYAVTLDRFDEIAVFTPRDELEMFMATKDKR